MNSRARDGAAVRIPPPLVFLVAIGLGALLHRWVQVLPLPLPALVLRATTLSCAVLGGALLAAALGLFRRSGQQPEPWKPTPEIISTGIYKYTRNPMYVGMALIQAAVGMQLGNGWILALIPAALRTMYLTAVRPEEAYLTEKFGQAYVDYQRAVRRWI